VNIILLYYYMSMETNGKPNAPFQQWQNFYPPYAFEPKDNDYMALAAINNIERNLTAGHSGITKDIHQTTLGLRDAIEKGNYATGHSIERNTGLVTSAVERNGGQNMSITERNAGKVMTAIEKVAGDNRLTTTVTDAASRAAAADIARDIAVAIERNGANSVGATQSSHGSLIGSIERNAGENRVTTVSAQGFLDAKITDVRHSVLNDINRVGSDLAASNVQNLNVLTKHVTDGAWESRQAITNGFATVAVGQERLKSDILRQGSDYYSNIMLEQQKMGQFLSSKSDSQFAMTQMEILKSKSDLSAQSAQQYACTQLEQQKLGAGIAAQMADAKYDALKNTQELGKQIAECCCELKEKNDTLDRERLRDGLNSANVDNNMLKLLEQARQGSGPLGNGILGGYGYPGAGLGGLGGLGGIGGLGGLGPNVGGYSGGYGNVHVYPDEHRRGRGHRRSRSRSRSRD
jgi:hypothetical protein